MCSADLREANMCSADLREANMCGANLREAVLWGVVGNMREIKSAQFDKWTLTWTQYPDGVHWLQIGCQRHTLEEWENASDLWIDDMDPDALEWWHKHRETVLGLVKASPATPWGAAQ
jgi:hypothetical protein